MASAPPKVASTEPAVEKPQPALKKDRGTVKSALSGDTLVVVDDKSNEKIITLSSLSAPKLARPGVAESKDEPFAWESREFLRKKAVGKKIQYAIDHVATGGREYVTVYLAPVGGMDPECLNQAVVSEGWATVHNKDAKRAEALVLLEDAAMQAYKGIHAKEKPKPIGKNDEDSDTLYRQLKGKPINAVVEKVRTGSSVNVTVLPSRHTFQILLSGVVAPGWRKKEGDTEPQPEPFAREAKLFVESHVLQREVTLTIEGIAKTGPGDKFISFAGSIEFQGHDVAEELLKAGLAKYAANSAVQRGADGANKLKAAEKSAKENKRRLYANYEPPTASNGPKDGVKSEFIGKVVNILNSGSIAVVPEGATKDVQINISSIRTPRPGFPGDEEREVKDKAQAIQDRADRYWAAEGKEALRRRLVGQKVRVVFDYSRKPQARPGEEKPPAEKSFYTVYHGDQNVAVILAESGLASVMQYKSEEDKCADYETLLLAEKKAQGANKGVHSNPEKVPARRINDLCVDNDPEKRAAQINRCKPMLASFERAGPMKAIVEYVFSGARFKVSVPKQSTVFMFALSGIRVPKRDEDGSKDLSDIALNFSREKLHQYEVTIEVDGLDKGGNFVGTLTQAKKNLAVLLLEAGYAYIHYASAERLKDFQELKTAEEGAKAKKIGYWADDLVEQRRLNAPVTEEREVGPTIGKTVEIVVTEVVDGARMYVQFVGPESAGLDELVNQLTEQSETEGSMPLITPKEGELVRALFSSDKRWYRAKVRSIEGEKYNLLYIDYGNSETVPRSSLRVLPANADLKAMPAQAQAASLAFVKPLKEDNENAKDAKDCLTEYAGGKKLQATIEYRDQSGNLALTLIDPSDNFNVSQSMVQQGLARLERRRRNNATNPNYVVLQKAEEEAKKRRQGMWHYGDIPDSDEDEREVTKKGAKPTGKDAKGKEAAAGGKKK